MEGMKVTEMVLESVGEEVEAVSSKATPASSAYKTRQSSTIFGLGATITQEDFEITGSRLPTCNQVLRSVMFTIQEGSSVNRTKWESAKIVLSKVSEFYYKANIPMISERKSCEKILKLLQDNAKVREIPIKRRNMPSAIKQIKQMESKLSETFSIWPVNAEELISNVEDREFLRSMKTDRLATFGSHDKVLHGKVKRRLAREFFEARRRKAAVTDVAGASASATISNTDSESKSGDETSDLLSSDPLASSITPRSHHRTARTGTNVFIPHDIVQRPKLVALATRLKMTPAQQAVYTQALIVEAGGDASKVSTSYATADRSRREVGESIAMAYKEEWRAPKLATLHWDSKLMSSLTNTNVNEERLTVVLGNATELKLLGVPSYLPGTDRKSGEIIAELTTKLLEDWHCSDSVVNLAFDTTASNTGHVTAACINIQQQLNRPLLWSGCRHHIGEIILTHIFNDLKIETSKSPDVLLFTRFRKSYELLDHTTDQQLCRLDLSQFNKDVEGLIINWRAQVLQLAQSELLLCRDDYLEFVELCTVFLDGDNLANPFSFKRPGALHKARWMAKLLYSIKICLLQNQINQLPPSTITTKQQVSKLKEFVTFVTLIYSSWWMSCSSAVDAPWNDLELIKQLLKYDAVNSLVSKSALHAFQLHMWYLTAEMVPLALFSDKVPANSKRALADRLLAVKPDSVMANPINRFGTGFGKPKFPAVGRCTTLADLVQHDSWFLFHVLKLDDGFLVEDVALWPLSSSYKTSAEHILAINVINDCAERGVKLSSDFLTSARTEQHYQNVLQVVEQSRRHQPDLRKRVKKH